MRTPAFDKKEKLFGLVKEINNPGFNI